MKQIDQVVAEIHESVNEMRDLKSQLEVVKTSLERDHSGVILAEKAGELIDHIDTWEQQLIQPQQKTYQDVINYPNQLNAQLLNLKKRVDTHDPSVTSGAVDRLEDLQKQWDQYQMDLEELLGVEIARFNEAYRDSRLPILIIPQIMTERTANSTNRP